MLKECWINKSHLLLQASSQKQDISAFNAFLQEFLTIEYGVMTGLLLILGIVSLFLQGGNGKLTSARMANSGDKFAAMQKSLEQMTNGKCQPCTLWIGTPKFWWTKNPKLSAFIQKTLGVLPTIWIPNAERGVLVVGAPGSGKTFSVINPLALSGLKLGYSMIIYDKKGDQMELFAPLARKLGYKVRVFAPGEPFSGVLNPLDFLTSSEDSVMAGVIGNVIQANANMGNRGSGNDFFDKAGAKFAQALVQLAKSTKYPDLAMVYAFTKLPDLVERISHSVSRPAGDPKRLSNWIATSFSQTLASKDAEKTLAGIKSSAEAIYSSFIQKDLLPSFMGASTIPLKLRGKELIIFKLDDSRREVVGPLLAVAIHLSIVANLEKKRSNPFVYVLDEFPSIVLKRIDSFVNEYRSNGGVPIIGIQNNNQLAETYGDRKANSITSGLSTHFLFQPGDIDTARKYSARFGDHEVSTKNRSVAKSNGTRTVTISNQRQIRPLISVDKILRFPTGQAIITSPAYGNEKKEALFPFMLKIPVDQRDLDLMKKSEKQWGRVENQLTELANSHQKGLDINAQLELRFKEAERILPPPEQLDGGEESEELNESEESNESKELNDDEKDNRLMEIISNKHNKL